MAIKNLEGLSTDDINRELAHGSKFFMYEYTISLQNLRGGKDVTQEILSSMNQAAPVNSN